ncbi:MAG: T9SS type A sorting domain-containing protein [Bacteroidota bacterium]
MSLTFAILQITINSQTLHAQTDGTLDNSFGTAGKVTTSIGNQDAVAYSVALQADGKIVAAGWSYTNGIYNIISVTRYKTNGNIDSTFGTAGIAFGPATNYSDAYATAIQTDGKILVAGFTENGSDNDFVLLRFNTDGTLDNTFGTAGATSTDFGSVEDRAFAMAVQTDGKIVLAGQMGNGSNLDIALARYNTNGTLDNTFGIGGKLSKAIGSGDDVANCIAIQADGKIVIGGYSWNGLNYDMAVLRYSNLGVLDNTFGTNGVIIKDIGSTDNYAYALALQTDSKIVVAGTATLATGDFSVVRLNSNGGLDNTFGTNGVVTTDFNGLNDEARAVIIQGNGKIVLAGFSSISGSNIDIALTRYESNGTLDNTFGINGKVTTPVGNSNDWAYAMLLQTDAKIVVAGNILNDLGTDDIALVRYYVSPTNVNDIHAENENISIYPNPAKNKISIQTTFPSKENMLSIYNTQGQLLYTKEMINNQLDLNIEKLAAGVYTLKITNSESTIIKKFIKE